MKFKSWFIKQFGKAPTMSIARREKLHRLVNKGTDAKAELDEEDMLLDKWEAALYAWQVKHD